MSYRRRPVECETLACPFSSDNASVWYCRSLIHRPFCRAHCSRTSSAYVVALCRWSALILSCHQISGNSGRLPRQVRVQWANETRIIP